MFVEGDEGLVVLLTHHVFLAMPQISPLCVKLWVLEADKILLDVG